MKRRGGQRLDHASVRRHRWRDGVRRPSIALDGQSKIRSINPGRDMPTVLDLIELGFQHELDPQGWKMLRQMRQIARSGALSRAVYGIAPNTSGYVWVEQGRVVGNLSLRRAQPHRLNGRMIGNVVVHPDWRGKGIGRALMQKGIATARDQGARWVGLEVRASNEVACRLYRDLGFQAVGRIEHLLRPDGVAWPGHRKSTLSWRKARPQDEAHWRRLATRMYAEDQRRVLEVSAQSYRFGGLERRLSLWLGRQRERAFVHADAAEPVTMALRVKTDCRYHYNVWELFALPDLSPTALQAMVDHCLDRVRRSPTWPTVAMVPGASLLVAQLKAIGFQHHRTLQQMILDL